MQSAFVAGVFEALSFGQRRMRAQVTDLTPEQLATVPTGLKNSIATLAVHTAAVEVNFAYRMRGEATPDELKVEYLLDQPQSPLPAPAGETEASLIAKLDKARAILQETLTQLADGDMEKEWVAPNGNRYTYRFMLAILANHQALHTGHMQYIRMLIG